MEPEKKLFYRIVKDGKINYMMVDEKSVVSYFHLNNLTLYEKSKRCKLVFDCKTLVALNPDVDR